MHFVYPNKVTYSEELPNGYTFYTVNSWNKLSRFSCEWNFEKITGSSEKLRDIQELKEKISPYVVSDSVILLGEGITHEYIFPSEVLSDFLAKLREIFKQFGYYDSERMTFFLPESTPCKITMPMDFFLYGSATKTWTSGSVRDGLRALNDGIIWAIALRSGEEAKKQIEEYLTQSHSSLLRLAECLHHGISQNSKGDICEYISLGSISWPEVPLE